MKKILSLVSLLVLSFFFVGCGTKSESNNDNVLNTYQKVTLRKVAEKIQNKEDFYLYVGRSTCHYCAKFSPNLEKAISNTQVEVYYLNTDEEDLDEVEAFAKNENIQTVPNLGYYQKGEKTRYLEKGSQSSLEEIEEFLSKQ